MIISRCLCPAPGLFSSWEKPLDAARNALRPAFDAEFEKAGFKNLGKATSAPLT